MSIRSTFVAALTGTIVLGSTALACGIKVEDAYARSARPDAPTGAAFMVLTNHSDQDDRLIAAHSQVAKKTELHTHRETGDGVMQMIEIEGGIQIPAGEKHSLKRGGDHVMFMGLTQELKQGETISVTLEFENAGELVIDVPVDNMRKAMGMHSHSGHSSE